MDGQGRIRVRISTESHLLFKNLCSVLLADRVRPLFYDHSDFGLAAQPLLR
jgi:hypothetical protein